MTSVPRLPRILLASTFALAAFAAAPALAEPAAPAPVPVPYPNTSSPNTSSQNAAARDAARDAASGLPTGKRMHKPYTLTTSTAQSASCAEPNVQPVVVASDPEEGGQVARTTGKVKVSDMTVTKKMDKASPMLAESSAPGNACPPGH